MGGAAPAPPPREGDPEHETTTSELIRTAAGLYERLGALGVLVIADPLPHLDDGLGALLEQGRVIVACRHPEVCREASRGGKVRTIELPDVRLGRSDQIKLAIVIGMTQGILPADGRLVVLVGRHASATIDTIMVVDLRHEGELLQAAAATDVARTVRPAVFHSVLRLAMEIASDGREGKKVGTIFVIGQHERVLALSRALIFNPFHGYPEEERNITNPAIWETIKEFAALDGAFLIRDDGVVIAAGRYLTASLPGEETVALGLGSRHAAAAGITALVDGAIAVVVSQSNGAVRVYRGGKAVLEIERPA